MCWHRPWRSTTHVTIMIKVWFLCVHYGFKNHVWGVPRSHRRCLDRIMWSFYHCIRLILWSKMIQNASTSIMTVDNTCMCHDYDQSVILVCSLRVKDHVWGVHSPCRRCLDRFMWLFYHYIRFYDQKWHKMCQHRSWRLTTHVTIIIKVWLVCVHYGLRITSGVFLDHIGGV